MPTYTLRVREGSHFLQNPDGGPETELKAGQIFKTDNPLHEKLENKFTLIGGSADDKEMEDSEDDWKDKTKFFPLAVERGVKVERNKDTLKYRVTDPSGETLLDDVKKSEVVNYLDALVESEETIKKKVKDEDKPKRKKVK